jgi:WD40 repeat protein
MLDWMDYEYEGRPGDVNVLAFSHAGDLVAEGADDGSLRVWDVATGELLSSAAARHNGRVTDLRFAPDDRTLVFWTSARWVGEMLDIFHLQEGTSRPLQNSPGTLAFSADGTLLAVSSPEGGVRLWVAHRGTEAMHFDTGKPVASLLFSADNLLLSASAPDGEEWVWEVRTGERVANAIRTHAFPAPGTWRPVWAGKRLEIREPRTDAVLGWTPFDHTIVAVWVTPDGARLRVADNGGSSHRPNIHLLEVVGFSKSNCA